MHSRSGMFLALWNGERRRTAWVSGRLAHKRQRRRTAWERGHPDRMQPYIVFEEIIRYSPRRWASPCIAKGL